MKEYYLAENMKTKGRFLNKIVILAPLLTILLSLGLTFEYYKVDCYNWWYMIMLPGSLSIVCILQSKIDGRDKNKNILNQPVDLRMVWMSKILVGVKNLSISSMVIFIFVNVISLVLPIKSVIDVPFLNGLCAILVLIITFMWQIPLIFIIAEKLGLSLTIIVSLGFNCISAVLAVESYWFVNPFSYPARLMCPILKILPNGLLAVPESVTFTPELLSYYSIPYGVIVSIILFIVFSYLTSKWFEKREAI